MSINFGVLKTNVGNRTGDTSTDFATIIGSYINQRYKDVLQRSNWTMIDDDYSITATSAAAAYQLPDNFGKELYVYNEDTAKDIPFMSIEKLEQEYASNLGSSGDVSYYSIFETMDSTAASASRIKKIKFYKKPSGDITFTVPYTLYPADLSADSDELVLNCETAVEYGATSDALMYKRQFAKAQYYEGLYEKAIQTLIWDKTNQPNEIHMMNPLALNRDDGI